MPRRLSSLAGELASDYAIVVVGSGYGGGIAAARLARAGQQVCVLERGREFVAGEFPNTKLESAKHLQASIPGVGPGLTPDGRFGDPLALLDFHIEKDFNVLRGCGLGGTSLINAAVALEAVPQVFADPRWPPELADDVDTRLREGYQRAREVLDPRTYPKDWPSLAKHEAHERSAAVMGERFIRVPLNIVFEDRVNAFGVEQRKCTLCGDCVSGCNHGAKTTVAASYLADAWNHGAAIFTQIAVDRIAARPDGRWAVHVTAVGTGRERFDPSAEQVIVADQVILAAGSLGSTEILLRSRAAGLSTSDRLGESFTGNADVLGFGYNNDRPINGVGVGAGELGKRAPVGPTITSAIDGRTPERKVADQFIIQEAALPGALDSIYPESLRKAAAAWGYDTDDGLLDSIAERQRIMRSRLPDGAYQGAVAHTQTYLGMAVDSGAGKLHLDDRGRLRVSWAKAGSEAVIAGLNHKMVAATAALGGTFVPNPMWSNLLQSSLISVHPLGGCSMGADASAGVTNHKGQVFAGDTGDAVHPGLYVMDGSVLPMSVGVNPLLTISAIAERNVALLAEDQGWTIPYALDHRPERPRGAVAPGSVGVRFTERMTGFIAPASSAHADAPDYAADHAAAAEAGEARGSSCGFVLTLTADDLDGTLADPNKRMRITGTVAAPALSPEPLQVSSGRFSLLSADPERHQTSNMIYAMTLTANDGRRWSFRGVKLVHDGPGFDLWSDTTTLMVDVVEEREGELDSGPAWRGILRIRLVDFARQLATIDVIGASSTVERLQAASRFGRFFVGSLFDTYGGIFARRTAFNPDGPPRKRRPLRVEAPEIHYFFTSDGVQLCLTHYSGGTKGPVILCHGLGVSSGIFTVDTIDTNLVEYLCAHGYDLWLLDFRVSIELPGASQQSNGDTIARIDYPEAVAEVRRLTGAPSVQMVVHCFGSTVFFMSMLGGHLEHVRAAVASQTAAHVEGAALVRLKSRLHMPRVLERLGVSSLTAAAEAGSGWFERLYDRALSAYPVAADEHCKSATCRRITFMYSLLYEHEQLAVATHDTLHELFGIASVSAFDHLAAMVRAKRLVDAGGNDIYLPHPERLAIPLRLIHGAENACFDPAGTAATLAWLRAHNDPQLYSRVVIPQFGHIDCIFGERAAAEVYPHILAHLEATLE